MNEQELLAALSRPGWTVLTRRPYVKTVLDEDTGKPVIAPDGKAQTYTTDEWEWVIGDGKGHNQLMRVRPVEGGSAKGGIGYEVSDPPKDLPAGAASPTSEEKAYQQAHAGLAQAQTGQLQAEEAEKDRNAANGFGRVTDAELAKQQQAATQQNQAGQQADRAAGQADRAAAQRDREISIAEANSKITAANSALAMQRADIESRLAAGQLDLEGAKFEYSKAKDASDREVEQQRLAITSAQQQSTAEYQSGQLANQQGQLANQQAQTAETARSNQATEAYQGAQVARGAAGDLLTNEQAQQTQATQRANIASGLLNQRVSSGTGLLNNLVGLAGGSGGGKMFNVPAGLGQSLVGGVQNYVTGLGGGQSVYDTAAKVVQNLAPSMPSQQAALATGALQQMLEKYQAQTGQSHPVADQVANQPPPDQQAQDFTAPPVQGQGGAQPVININFHAPQLMADSNLAGPQRGPLSG